MLEKVSTPKRHHFLPRFFLEGFSRDGHVAVYDREKNEYRVQNVKDTAVIGYYYSAIDEEGNKDGRIESLLSAIESEAKPVIAKMDNHESLNNEDRERLAVFIGFLFARTPEFEAMVNQISEGGIKHMMRIMYPNERLTQQRYGKDLERFGLTAKAMVDFVQEDHYKIVLHRNASLHAMLQLGMSLSNMFLHMNWLIAHPETDKQSFVLTDSPVNVYPPRSYKPGFYGVGMAMRGVVKVIPLSARTCLGIGDFADEPLVVVNDTSRDMVRNTNLGNVFRCHRYVIGRDEALIHNLVTTTQIDKKPWEPKVRVG